MKRALLLFALLTCGSAFAATAPTGSAPGATPPAGASLLSHHDANQPIAVSADNFVAEKNPATAGGITGTYSGNVIITQGDIRMRSDTVRILVADNKPQKIFFNGNVVVNSASGTATGDSGVYDVVPRLVTLSGHVVLTKEKNVMRGAQLTVNLVTGIAQLGGGANGTRGRVQGLFTPPPQSGSK
ncbi:MAG TPA: LptA/OstA family protein [Rhizomicrobium sp.]|nr:LptA/OstA family protein [Rhizomicrobium sp.]